MAKKMKRFEEGGYTGDDEIVKYRMGMIDAEGKPTKKAETSESTSDERTSSYGEQNEAPETSSPAKKAVAAIKKTVAPAVKEAAKDSSWEDNSKIESPAPKKGADKLRSELGIGKPSAPKMIRGKTDTGVDLKKALFGGSSESPRMKAAKRSQAMDASNYSMKKGGTVKRSSASKRADGIAIRGKTRA